MTVVASDSRPISPPQGQSVNDGIKPELCSSEEEAVSIWNASLVPNALVAKMDLKNVYQMVLVHAEDQHLLAVRWKGATRMDGALPFRLRSAPQIENVNFLFL